MPKDQSKAIGGKARALALSPDRRREIASKAAMARWGNRSKVMSGLRIKLQGGPNDGSTHYLLYPCPTVVVCERRPTLGKQTEFHTYRQSKDQPDLYLFDQSEESVMVSQPR